MSKLSFTAAVKAFQDLQSKYQDFGAWDTEPRGIFVDMVERIAEGKEARVPTYGQDSIFGKDTNPWSLYSDMKGAYFATRSLTAAANKVANADNAQAEAKAWMKAEYGIEVW